MKTEAQSRQQHQDPPAMQEPQPSAAPLLETAIPPEGSSMPLPPREDLCQFPFADGRHCRMPRWKKHDNYCLVHAREEQQLLGVEEVSEQLVSLSGEFKTASDVNHVLGRLFSLRAHNRISRRDAVALTYMAQLMLQTLPGVRREIMTHQSSRGWDSTLERVFNRMTEEMSDDSEDQSDA
jgi:hypothetical protein